MSDEENNLLSLFGDLRVTLGHVAKTQQAVADKLATVNEAPIWADIAGNVTIDVNGFGIIQFNQEPSQGYMWFVRRLIVGGDSPGVPAAGRVDVYRGAGLKHSFTNVTQIGMMGWEDFSTTLPARAQYAEGELMVKAPERLYCVISGATPAQQYVAQVRVQVIQEAAYATTWSL